MLAITGGKGGCGKTTTALGVARALAKRGATPLVVDTDTDMPDLHHSAAIPREPGMDQLARGSALSSVVRESDEAPGVRLLTGGSRQCRAIALRKVRDWDGPVVLDCPPGLGPGAVGPLRAASVALVVTSETPVCREDATQTVRTLRQVGTDPLGCLLVKRSNERPPCAIAGCRVLATVPFVRNPLDRPAVVRGWRQIAECLWSAGVESHGSGQATARTRLTNLNS